MVLREPDPENTGAAALEGEAGAGWLCWDGHHIATATQGRDTDMGRLLRALWNGVLRIAGLCSRLLLPRRETAASMDHPKELARAVLRKLCCWVKPMGKSVGVDTSTKKQDNVNCFIIHLGAASGRERERGKKQESGEREKL